MEFIYETVDLDISSHDLSIQSICRTLLDGAIKQMQDRDITECQGCAHIGPVKITLTLKVEKFDG